MSEERQHVVRRMEQGAFVQLRRALPLVLFLAACSSESREVPSATVQDSAGIRMVENVVPGGDVPVYGTVGEPDLEIGVVEGDPVYVFSFVADARTLPNGDVVVVDGGFQGTEQELRIFDSGGRHLRTIGRRGKGPGEFTRLTPLAGVSGERSGPGTTRSGD